jgi:hypothetical protein
MFLKRQNSEEFRLHNIGFVELPKAGTFAGNGKFTKNTEHQSSAEG